MIPYRYAEARLEDFAPGDLQGAWWQGAELGQPRNVLITGGNGTGKTHLAAAIAQAWGAYWTTALEVLLRVRATYRPGSEDTELRIVEELSDYRVLVLDDLSAARLNPHALTTLLALLTARIDNPRRSTVATSFLPLAELDKLDSSLASRLAGFAQVRTLGADRRLPRPTGPSALLGADSRRHQAPRGPRALEREQLGQPHPGPGRDRLEEEAPGGSLRGLPHPPAPAGGERP